MTLPQSLTEINAHNAKDQGGVHVIVFTRQIAFEINLTYT